MLARHFGPLWARSAPPSFADMWERRITYLVALLGSLVFYVFYKEWFSWILFLEVALLPWFSLVLSLPAMLTVKAVLRCPAETTMGMPTRTALGLSCKFPAPPVGCRIRLVNNLTGVSYIGQPGEKIPTEHCGMMEISFPELVAYDYLGLFRKKLPIGDRCTVYVLPKPVAAQAVSQPVSGGEGVLQPKPGGGFSEEHELRLYRPGDELRNIHWKMSAKTGKLIYREPMEPVLKGYILTLTLSGDPAQLDKKLGQLLWVSRWLLSRQLPHEVRCMTGNGLKTFAVENEDTLEKGLKELLSSPQGTEAVQTAETSRWQHHIGGDGNEA